MYLAYYRKLILFLLLLAALCSTSTKRTSKIFHMATNNTTLADFIWKNADDLWGHFKHVEFGKIILPFTLLRRLECVLEPTREKVLGTIKAMEGKIIELDIVLP